MQPDLPEWASAISFPGDLICHPFLERHCTSILFGCQAEVTTKRHAQFMIRIQASAHQDDDTRQYRRRARPSQNILHHSRLTQRSHPHGLAESRMSVAMREVLRTRPRRSGGQISVHQVVIPRAPPASFIKKPSPGRCSQFIR